MRYVSQMTPGLLEVHLVVINYQLMEQFFTRKVRLYLKSAANGSVIIFKTTGSYLAVYFSDDLKPFPQRIIAVMPLMYF